MNKVLPVNEAMAELRRVGYYVEHTAHGIIHVRKTPNGMPARLYTTTNGRNEEFVSERATKALVNAIGIKVHG